MFRRACFVMALLGTGLHGQNADISGQWLGELNVGPQTLRMALHLNKTSGTWESLDQGAKGLPVKKLEVTGQAVKIDLGIASYEGVVDASGGQISGTFHQGSLSVPLTFRRVDKIEEPKRPQNPARPFPYKEEEVGFRSAGVELAGTLTLPKSGTPFTAALLITGSGPQDRDEALMGHKPFLVLSDYLTRAGFAVLRLDDRGMGKSTGVFATATYADKVADVLAGIDCLRARKDIDARRIGVIGHREGAAIGPLAASKSGDIAFVVMMAGMGLSGDKVLRQQAIDVLHAQGADAAAVGRAIDTQGRMIAALREEKDNAAALKRIRESLGDVPVAEAQAKGAVSPTFRDLVNFDPAPTLQSLACPVLALGGTLDVQVSAKQNLPAIAAALAVGRSRNWSVVPLPDLNHLLQTAKTGAVAEYSQIEETMAPLALQTIGDWLTRNFLRR